jgi:arylsulfatase A-like enzyme
MLVPSQQNFVMKTIFIAWSMMLIGISCTSAADSQSSKPNVLFIIADDASPHFGAAYNCSWAKTPNIDRLAQQGLVFTHAYTPTAKCAPSRSAILTGRNPWQLEQAANHQSYFPAKFKAFSEVLREAGVHVGGAGKIWGPGQAKNAEGLTRNWGMMSVKANPTGFREFLASRPQNTPFFFWYGSHNPHRAYQPGSGIQQGAKLTDIDRVPSVWPDNDVVRGDLLDYAKEITDFDTEVGELLKVLESTGNAANTLVIVTSDNGMPFPRSKGHNYDISNHLPLVACWPAGIAKPGRKVADLVSFIDFAPTFLDLMGIEGEKAGMAPITGRSFHDLLRNTPQHDRSFVILGRERNDLFARPGTDFGLGYPVRAIRAGNYLYLHNFQADRWPCGDPELGLKDTDSGPTKQWIENLGAQDAYWQLAFGKRPAEELYDLSTGADCVHNLAQDAKLAAKTKELREKLFAELKRQQDPRILGQGDLFDGYSGTKPLPPAKSKPNKS